MEFIERKSGIEDAANLAYRTLVNPLEGNQLIKYQSAREYLTDVCANPEQSREYEIEFARALRQYIRAADALRQYIRAADALAESVKGK